MAQTFLTLPDRDRLEILNTQAAHNALGLTPALLEKDVWVCWALQSLYEIEGAHAMAFKGGTSLSKVYDVIARFSEDVDITIDRKGLSPECAPFEDGLSGSQKKKIRAALEELLAAHLRDVILPGLEAALHNLGAPGLHLEFDQDIQSIVLHYPTVTEGNPYIPARVLLEFGGCNALEPAETHQVTPYLSVAGDLQLPKATVNALAATRTFWEKATLIHLECNRGIRASADRIARHWYDLFMLNQSEHGPTAIKDHALLQDVILHKETFYRDSRADYAACTSGRFRLVPDNDYIGELQKDFESMEQNAMFFRPPPSFDELLAEIQELERTINRTLTSK